MISQQQGGGLNGPKPLEEPADQGGGVVGPTSLLLVFEVPPVAFRGVVAAVGHGLIEG